MNSEFDRLLSNTMKNFGSEYVDESELDNTPHRFSEDFQQRMDVLIKNENKPIQRRKIQIWKHARYWIAAAIAASLFIFPTGAIKFKYFDIHLDQLWSEYQIDQDIAVDVDMSVKYQITEGLDGYKLKEYHDSPLHRIYVYETEALELHFCQINPFNTKTYVDTERFPLQYVTVDGNEGFYIDRGATGSRHLVWYMDNYLFEIYTQSKDAKTPIISKDALFEMAKSVQKVE